MHDLRADARSEATARRAQDGLLPARGRVAMQGPTDFLLVVMESGADWPAELDPRDFGCAILKQQVGESCRELATRATERIASIAGAGGVFRVAVLACNGQDAPSAFAGRAAVGRAVLEAAARPGGAGIELRLVAPEDASVGARVSFLALAGELTETLSGRSDSVSLQFRGKRIGDGGRAGAGRDRRSGRDFERRMRTHGRSAARFPGSAGRP